MTTADQIKKFIELACLGDLNGVRAMIAVGFDPASPHEGTMESILTSIILLFEWQHAEGGWSPEMIEELSKYKADERHTIVRELIALDVPVGPATPEEWVSPLMPALCAMDTKMVRILLDAGADPNVLDPEDSGLDDQETLLEFAEDEYVKRVWSDGWSMLLPEPLPSTSSMDKRLAEIDRQAVKYGKRRPDHLLLVRARGAKTLEEIRARSSYGQD